MNNDLETVVRNKIKLTTGQYIDLISPDAKNIHIFDIATSLSRLCRYNGHGKFFYSVAEHCVLATRASMRNVDAQSLIKAILMHDAPEAYLGDIARPLKVLLPMYAKLESRFEELIGSVFDIDFVKLHDDIKYYDNAMLKPEKDMLFGERWIWGDVDSLPNLGIEIQLWTPERACREFLSLYYELFSE